MKLSMVIATATLTCAAALSLQGTAFAQSVDIITAPGMGGGPHVSSTSGAVGPRVTPVVPQPSASRQRPATATKAGPGGGPHVRTFNSPGGSPIPHPRPRAVSPHSAEPAASLLLPAVQAARKAAK